MNEEVFEVIRKKLDQGYTLPVLSSIAVRLVEVASDEDSTIDELSNLIEKDPSLAVRVLKLANSAFFQTVTPATTLRSAILRLGFQQLRMLALTLSLKDTFPLGRVGQMNYEEFWRVSLYRSLVARSLAATMETRESDEAFIAGLTLEIGYLIFYDLFVKGKEVEIKDGIYPLEALLAQEKEKCGINHRELGEFVLDYWKFPPTIYECQRFYGFSGDHGGVSPLSKICRASGKISALICYSKTDFGMVYEDVQHLIGINQEIINDVMLSAFNEVGQIADVLRVRVEGEKDLLGLVEKANRALHRLNEEIIASRCLDLKRSHPSFETIKAGESTDDGVMQTLKAVAHEIRNPLTAVGGFAKKLSNKIDPDSDGWKYVQIIMEETKRLENVLSEMAKIVNGGRA